MKHTDNGRGSRCVAPEAMRPLRARVVEVSDEATERVARDELLALELGARRRRGVVGLEPLLDGAALVRKAVDLFCVHGGEAELDFVMYAELDDAAS